MNFHIYAYADTELPIVLKDAEGVPLDLTGYTGFMQVRREPDSAVVVVEPEVVIDAANGKITIKFSDVQTALMVRDPDGDLFYHNLLLTSPDGTVEWAYQGAIYGHYSVTRPVIVIVVP